MAVKNKEGQPVFPSWSALLKRAAEVARGENKESQANDISSLVDQGNLHLAAELAKEALVGENWNNFLEDQFDVNLEELDYSSSSLQKSLLNLSSRLITLNYDQCLEWANSGQANYTSFDNSNNAQLRNFKANRSDKDMIWHLHGTIKNSEHIVLTPQSYQRLYGKGGQSEYSAALSALKDLMSTESLLFVGSSMSDVELLAALNEQNLLFSGNTGPHYVLVRASQKSIIERVLGELTNVIEILTFPEFGDPLVEVIDNLASHSAPNKMQTDTQDCDLDNNSQSQQVSCFDNVSIHFANPIDKPNDYDYLNRFAQSFRGDVQKYYLSNESLWADSDYTFIFTKLTKNGFLIEDESCCYDYIPLQDFFCELSVESKGVFIFVDNIPDNITGEIIEEYTDLPIALYCLDTKSKKHKRVVNGIHQQLFKKKNLAIFDKNIICNKKNFDLDANLSGTNQVSNINKTKTTNVDKRSTTKFIGRSSDLSLISREMIRIESKGLALVLKGSGGIGKTTIANKLALEYSERGKFKEGITFIDCEPITSYELFYQKISEAFSFSQIYDLEDHLMCNEISGDLLIILDNYESILNLDNDKEKFLKLTGIINDYCSLLITSRDRCQEPWEHEVSLRSLDPNEGLEIFNSHSKCIYDKEIELRYLKEEIIENLLDCNPLAIELVALNTPPGKDIYELEKDLIREFESIEDSTYYLTSKSDSNITRKKSLLGSINYSYNTLNEQDKKALELISLFPDGISLRNLREIVKNQRSKIKGTFNLSDRTIKTLSDKSLLINSGRDIKLHSIVSRFTLSKAKNNKSNEVYWKDIARYNFYFLRELDRIYVNHEFITHQLITSYINNLLITINTTDKLELDEKLISELLIYTLKVSEFSAGVSIIKPVEKAVLNLKRTLSALSVELNYEQQTLLDLTIHSIFLTKGCYENSLEKLRKIIPIESLSSDFENGTLKYYINRKASELYSSHGNTEIVFRHTVDSNLFGCFYPHALLYAGVISDNILEICDVNVNYFEACRISNKLSEHEVINYIDSLHPKEHSERCTMHFFLNKITPLTEKQVSKLVSIDPLDSALKLAMKARILWKKYHGKTMSSDDKNRISVMYERAIEQLYIVKYMQLTILNEYCEFLLEIMDKDKFEVNYNTMNDITLEYSYPYWSHEITRLKDPTIPPFNPIDNMEPYGVKTENYIRNFVRSTIDLRKQAA